MEIFSYQGFVEWFLKIIFGAYLPHLHNIVGNILPNKMVSKRHNFLVQDATMVSLIQHQTNFVPKYMCRFIDIDTYSYKVILEHNRLLDSLLQRCEIGTEC